MSKKTKNLLQRFDEIPPFVVFRMAKRGRRRHVPFEEIVRASGLAMTTFCRIAQKASWSNVKLGQIDSFCRACGVDFMNIWTKRRFLMTTIKGQRPFSHLSNRQLNKLNQKVKEWNERRKGSLPS